MFAQYVSCFTKSNLSNDRNGSLLATTSKDKVIRIIDPRSGEVLRKGDCHRGTKASKVRIKTT